ncbi:MAG: Rrf2 family transcriptional regulator [Oceanicaulis sp.]|nr:Rrf2 family transcriptional regulator [Oceanicaulis sp.]
MSRDHRLSRMLHVLIHMGQADKASTSQEIAAMLNTHPVVVRRTMAGLRDQGYVMSEKGHGGGWRLTRPLDQITLLDVHRALEPGALFAIGPSRDSPDCLVERAVNASMADAFARAEAVLIDALRGRTLADIVADMPQAPHCEEEGRSRGHTP